VKTNKHELQYMTWKEIDEAFKNDPVIFIPMGSMEEHGPHSITGDYIAAYEIAKSAAEQSNSYCIPVIPFGYSEYFRCFPGTISVSPTTFYSLMNDICVSLMEHGIKKIIFVNGHAGNASILDMLARDIRREKNIMVGKIDLWQSMTPEFKKELYGDKVKTLGHGGDPITSVMHYLRPDDMRMDLLSKYDRLGQWEDFNITNISKTNVGDTEVTLYYDMDEITKQGTIGDPYLGSNDKGEKIINKLIEYCVEFAIRMKKSNTVLK
jgi:creatinine amidohydrolase